MDKQRPFLGIDYGRKFSGNTVIGYKYEDEIAFVESEKNHDADKLIVDLARQLKPEYIFLDAPLSLPRVYFNPAHEAQDYFYRQCDRDLHAMSPMFLGGMTARAIRLRHRLENEGFIVKEVYPAALADLIKLGAHGYKEKTVNIGRCINIITQLFNLHHLTIEDVPTWHHLDALLAMISGWRYLEGKAIRYGNPGEGIIHI